MSGLYRLACLIICRATTRAIIKWTMPTPPALFGVTLFFPRTLGMIPGNLGSRRDEGPWLRLNPRPRVAPVVVAKRNANLKHLVGQRHRKIEIAG